MVVGHRDMLPERVKAAAEKAEEMTKNNDRYVRTYVRNIRIDSVARAITCVGWSGLLW